MGPGDDVGRPLTSPEIEDASAGWTIGAPAAAAGDDILRDLAVGSGHQADVVSSHAVTTGDLVAIAARCASGDRSAQRELFLRTRGSVHRTLYRILGNNNDVEDLLQETYLMVFRGIDRFEGRSSPTTWCCGIAVHVAYNHLRAARRRRYEPEVDPVDPGADVARLSEQREAARRLYAALEQIDVDHRIAFSLVIIDGQPVAAVAEQLGVTPGAVKTRVWRARRQLEKLARKDPALSGYVRDLCTEEDAA